MRTLILSSLVILMLLLCACQPTNSAGTEAPPSKPNIIFIMVDDLGYGDLGVFGQKVIQTPNIDQMATEGRMYTQCYAGSPVCAPSRSTLMTGLHTGHTTVRGNKSPVPVPADISPNPVRVPLFDEDITVAEVLKSAGYTTGMFGKWGLGEHNSAGEPNDQGFDEWLGFLNQKRAHNHYPDYFWSNKDTFLLEGNSPKYNTSNTTYSHDLFTQYALGFVERHQERNFFLYLPYCLPHDAYQIPQEDTLRFADQSWTPNEKVYAAMVEKIDADVGQLFTLLKALELDKNTLVLFCSDNGAAQRWQGRFNSSGALKGRKRDMYEGGIRTPMIAWMPGTIPANTTSTTPWYFPDVMPTLASAAGTKAPENIDGINMWEDLQGKDFEVPERYLYWEFHEGGFYQAIRWKDWKGIREGIAGQLELYDLAQDPGETNDISQENETIVTQLETFLDQARSESPYWPAK